MNDLLSRKGTFKVSEELIKSNPEGVIKTLKDVLVVRVDNDFMTNILTYWGYSKQFDLIQFEPTPEYVAEVINSNGEINIKWNKKNQYSENDVKEMLSQIIDKIKS